MNSCFWCGPEPTTPVGSYSPCPACKDKMSLGVVMIEAVDTPLANTAPIATGKWPTGRWCVMSPQSLHTVFTAEVAAKAVLDGKCLMAPEVADLMQHLIEKGNGAPA